MKNLIKKLFKKEEKSGLEIWAEKEIALACEREKAEDGGDGFFEYGCACYDSALKAFKSLLGDGHSGYSIDITKYILNRLIDGQPLTPIEDTPDVWKMCDDHGSEKVKYQCKRMGSLFKDVYYDGRIEYHDVDSCYCLDVDSGSTFSSSLSKRLYNEMFPITMPYMPTKPAVIHRRDILTDPKNGDFDTVAILCIVKADGEKIEVNRFFKEGPHDWEEINADEYAEREKLAASIK